MNKEDIYKIAEEKSNKWVKDLVKAYDDYEEVWKFVSAVDTASIYPPPKGLFKNKCPLCNSKLKTSIISRGEYRYSYKFSRCLKCEYLFSKVHYTAMNNLDSMFDATIY